MFCHSENTFGFGIVRNICLHIWVPAVGSLRKQNFRLRTSAFLNEFVAPWLLCNRRCCSNFSFVVLQSERLLRRWPFSLLQFSDGLLHKHQFSIFSYQFIFSFFQLLLQFLIFCNSWASFNLRSSQRRGIILFRVGFLRAVAGPSVVNISIWLIWWRTYSSWFKIWIPMNCCSLIWAWYSP